MLKCKNISGSSGAGMVLKIDGLWKLAGMVSTCITKPDHCDLNNYLVYTDVSKFNSWIEQVFIESYDSTLDDDDDVEVEVEDVSVSAGRSVLGNTFQINLFIFIFLCIFFF
jgi:hypothetical protein